MSLPPPAGGLVGKRKRVAEPTTTNGTEPPVPTGAPPKKAQKIEKDTGPKGKSPQKAMKLIDEPGRIKAGQSSAPSRMTSERVAIKKRARDDQEKLKTEGGLGFAAAKGRRYLGGLNRDVARDISVFRDCMGTFGMSGLTSDLMIDSVGGQAKAAGLRAGDVITHVDGIPVHNHATFARAVAEKEHKSTFTVLRSSITPIWKCLKAEGCGYRSKPTPGAKVDEPSGPAGGEEVEIIREADGWLQTPEGLWLPVSLENPAKEKTIIMEKKLDSFLTVVWDLKSPLGVQLYFPFDSTEPQVKDITNVAGVLGRICKTGDKIVQLGEWELTGIQKAQFDDLVFGYKEERQPLDIVIRCNAQERVTTDGELKIINKKVEDPKTEKSKAPVRLEAKGVDKAKPKVTIKPVTAKLEKKEPVAMKDGKAVKAALTDAQKKAIELVGELPPTETIPPEELKDADAISMDLLFSSGSTSICLVCLSKLNRTHWDIHANGFKHQRAFKINAIRRKRVERKRSRSRGKRRGRSWSKSRRAPARRRRSRSPRRRPTRRRSPARRRSRSKGKRRGHRSKSKSGRSKSASVDKSAALNMSLDDVARGKADKKKQKRSRSRDKKKKKKSRSRSKSKKKKKSRKSRSRSKSSKKKDKKKKKKKAASSRSTSSSSNRKKKKKKKKESDTEEPPKKKSKKEKSKKKEVKVEEDLRKKALATVGAGGFSVGDKVVLKNLRSTPKFNGAVGVITDVADGDRWPVKITEPEKKHFAIKAKNLDKYDPDIHAKKEQKSSTQPIAFIGEWFVYPKGEMKYFYNSRTKKTTWSKPPGEERPMSEFKK